MEDEAHAKLEGYRAAALHGVVVLVLLVQLIFHVPIFADLWNARSGFPRITDVTLEASRCLRERLFFCLPVVAALLWADAKCYSYLCRACGRAKAWFWTLGVLIMLSCLLVFVTWCLTLPFVYIRQLVPVD